MIKEIRRNSIYFAIEIDFLSNEINSKIDEQMNKYAKTETLHTHTQMRARARAHWEIHLSNTETQNEQLARNKNK